MFKLELENISKSFPGVVANDNISIDLKQGEIHAILGENGSGKTTLMNILFGLKKADSGQIFHNGKPVKIKSPLDALHIGIGMVHQHFKLVASFTVLENIILGVEETKIGVLQYENARKKISDLMNEYNFTLDMDLLVSELSAGEAQQVEILKILYRDVDILIFDEPTSILSPLEIDGFMRMLAKFSENEKSVLLITHKLAEIKQVADRCTVLRKGKRIATVDVVATTEQELARMMTGQKSPQKHEPLVNKPSQQILQIKKLSLVPHFEQVSFNLHTGEILCITGLVGNGQSELIEALWGTKIATTGSIKFRDNELTSMSVKNRIKSGIAYIPEDRQRQGLVLDFTIAQNLVLNTYQKYKRFGVLNKLAINENAKELITRFNIKTTDCENSFVRDLSGGNQQKVVLARELSRNPDVLLAVAPSQGLDLLATRFIRDELLKQRSNGKSVILVSYDIDEIMELADRIIILKSGSISKEIAAKDITPSQLGIYMSGLKEGYNDEES